MSEKRMAEIKKEITGIMKSNVSAIKCSYCRKLYKDDKKEDMGFETDNWAICFRCFKKLCDKVGAG